MRRGGAEGRCRAELLPRLNSESRHALQLSKISRHDDEAVCHRRRRDDEIALANRHAGGRERVPNARMLLGGLHIECDHVKHREEGVESGVRRAREFGC